MAAAIAEDECARRGLDIDIISGGTDPADEVHGEVVDVMEEIGLDLRHNVTRSVHPEDLESADYVITMGCGSEGVCPNAFTGDSRDWDLTDPHGKDRETVRSIRDTIKHRVVRLLDEVSGD